MPEWMRKHPCETCGVGYGQCSTGLASNLMCCDGCEHPTRWEPNPWTADEYEEMWKDKNPPQYVLDAIANLRKKEVASGTDASPGRSVGENT